MTARVLRPHATHLSLRDQQIRVKDLVMSIASRIKSKSWLGKNSRGLAKYDQHSSSIGLVDNLSCLRDQQIQVKDLVDDNRETGDIRFLIGQE